MESKLWPSLKGYFSIHELYTKRIQYLLFVDFKGHQLKILEGTFTLRGHTNIIYVI